MGKKSFIKETNLDNVILNKNFVQNNQNILNTNNNIKSMTNQRSRSRSNSNGSRLGNESTNNKRKLNNMNIEDNNLNVADLMLERHNPKKGSISWECLPFSSRKKQNAKSKNKKAPNETNNDNLANTTGGVGAGSLLAVNSTLTPQQSNENNQIKNINYAKNAKMETTLSSTNTTTTTIHNKIVTVSTSTNNSNQSQLINTKTQHQQQQPSQKHHPYSASLVNSGFGFGFDLQGGESDNQLTFIVNVQPNGDAARKGLADGDILVSIQGKNVIGIRRNAIERILKQYKVDQEIEIVVCRLKDPSFLVNLAKIANNKSNNINNNSTVTSNNTSNNNNNTVKQVSSSYSQANSSSQSQINSFDSAKYRSLNEQIFNELISFQDPAYNQNSNNNNNNNNNNRSARSLSHSNVKMASNNSSKKLNQQIPVPISNSNRYQLNELPNQQLYVSETSLKQINANKLSLSSSALANKYKSQQTSTINPSYNQSKMDENLISIQLNNNNVSTMSKSSSSSVSEASSSYLRNIEQNDQKANNQHRITMPNSNSQQNLQRDSKSSYYNDISVVVYDNLIDNTSNNNKNGSDVVVVSVKPNQNTINYHPQIQPMTKDLLDKSILYQNHHHNSKLPVSQQFTTNQRRLYQSQIGLGGGATNNVHHSYPHHHILNTANKSQSVNDFTGSIIEADRMNYLNKQSSKNSNNNKTDFLYSNVIRKESNNANAREEYNTYLKQQEELNRIPIIDHIPNRSKQQQQVFNNDLYRDALELQKQKQRRSSSEQINNNSNKIVESKKDEFLIYEKTIGFQNSVIIKNSASNKNNETVSEPPLVEDSIEFIRNDKFIKSSNLNDDSKNDGKKVIIQDRYNNESANFDVNKNKTNFDYNNLDSNSYEIPINIKLNNNLNNKEAQNVTVKSSSSKIFNDLNKPLVRQRISTSQQPSSSLNSKQTTPEKEMINKNSENLVLNQEKLSPNKSFSPSSSSTASLSSSISSLSASSPRQPANGKKMPKSIDIEIYNTSSIITTTTLTNLKQEQTITITPRKTRHDINQSQQQQKPYQIYCDEAVLMSNKNIIKENEEIKIDKDEIENKKQVLTDLNKSINQIGDASLSYSNLSIKYIDDVASINSLSSPIISGAILSKESDDKTKEDEKQQTTIVESSSHFVKNILESVASSIKNENAKEEVEINDNSKKVETTESTSSESAVESPPPRPTATNLSSLCGTIDLTGANSTPTEKEKKKKRKHRHSHSNNVKRSLTLDGIQGATVVDLNKLKEKVKEEKEKEEHKEKQNRRRDRRNRYTLPLANKSNQDLNTNDKVENIDKINKSSKTDLIKSVITSAQISSTDILNKQQTNIVTTTTSSDDDQNNKEKRKPRSKPSSFIRREREFKRSIEFLKQELANSKNEEENKIEKLKRADSNEKVLEWQNSNSNQTEDSNRISNLDSNEESSIKTKKEQENNVENNVITTAEMIKLEEEIDAAFKSGVDSYSLAEESQDEISKISNREETEISKNNISSSLNETGVFSDLEVSTVNVVKLENVESSSIINKPQSIIKKHHTLSGTKSDTEAVHELAEKKTKKEMDDYQATGNRVVTFAPTELTDANKSSVRKSFHYDSTDTLDSASSYEIRFERPHLKQQHEEARRKNLEEKNNQWNILSEKKAEEEETASNIIEPVVNEESKKTDEQKFSEKLVDEYLKLEEQQEDLNDEKLPPTPLTDESVELNLTLTDEVKKENKNELDKSLESSDMINTSAGFPSNINSPDQTLIKEEHLEKTSQSINDTTEVTRFDHDSDLNSDSFSVNEVTKNNNIINESESIENIQIQLVESNVADFIPETETTEKLEEQTEQAKKENKKEVENVLFSSSIVAPSSVGHDDGYASTASFKNAANESCSSMDDLVSEISTGSSTITTAKTSSRKQRKESPIQSEVITEITQILEGVEVSSTEEISTDKTETVIEEKNVETDIKHTETVEKEETQIAYVTTENEINENKIENQLEEKQSLDDITEEKNEKEVDTFFRETKDVTQNEQEIQGNETDKESLVQNEATEHEVPKLVQEDLPQENLKNLVYEPENGEISIQVIEKVVQENLEYVQDSEEIKNNLESSIEKVEQNEEIESDELNQKINHIVELVEKKEEIDRVIEHMESDQTKKQIDHTLDLISELILDKNEDKVDNTLDLIAEVIVNDSNKKDLMENKHVITDEIIDSALDLIIDVAEKKKKIDNEIKLIEEKNMIETISFQTDKLFETNVDLLTTKVKSSKKSLTPTPIRQSYRNKTVEDDFYEEDILPIYNDSKNITAGTETIKSNQTINMTKETKQESSSSDPQASVSTNNKKSEKPHQQEVDQLPLEPPSILDIVPPPVPPVSSIPTSPVKSNNAKVDKLAPLVEPEVSTSNVATPVTNETIVNSSSSKVVEREQLELISTEISSNALIQQHSSSASSSPYKSSIAPRNTVVSRRANSNSSGLVHHQSNQFTNSIISSPISLRGPSNAIKETRHKEKLELCELNDRFAGYVERVRFLEAQNKKLQIELNMLKSKWGQETRQIEKMYQVELEEARSVLNDTSKQKSNLQLKLDKSQQELDNIKTKYTDMEKYLNEDKDKIAKLREEIASNEAELGLLKRRLSDLQDEEKRYKQETQRMMSEIQRVQFELETEMKQRIMLENDKQSLEEELVFIRELHSKEIDELKSLVLHDSGLDPTIFFKSELSNAIKEIREEYEAFNQAHRNEMEGWYKLKLNEIQRKSACIASNDSSEALNREQAKKLKSQVVDTKKNVYELKAINANLEARIKELEEEMKREENESSTLLKSKETEINALRDNIDRFMADYEELLATKSDLEVEIRTYRKLLEGEENREGLKQIVENIEQRVVRPALTNSVTHNAITSNGYSSDRDQSPLKKVALNAAAKESEKTGDASKKEFSSRRFGGLLSSSKSHHDGIQKHTRSRLYESPLRKSILESETADDSSAAEDFEDRVKAKRAGNNTLPKRESYGEIQLDLIYDLGDKKLKLKVNQARDLFSNEKDSTSDPYVRLMLLPDKKKRTKRKTKVIKESLSPVWDESFEFAIELDECKTKTIDVLVKNSRSLFSRERTFMGQCLVDLSEIENLEIAQSNWYHLKDRSVFEARLKKLHE